MRSLLFFLFSLFFFFAGGFYVGKLQPKLFALRKTPSVSLEGTFLPALFPMQNRSFVVLIIGKNNGAGLEKTLESVFFQRYEEYRVIYIDDGSTDGSFELARDLILESGQMGRVTLVKNETTLGHLANVWRAVQGCSDEEIAVILSGEDRLAHEWVLDRLNQYYANPDLWISYGQYLEYPSFKKGICRSLLPQEEIRKTPFVASHLKSFYASLFKRIQESDFLYQGRYFPVSGELAYMIPMLEMAKGHTQYIDEVLYLSLGAAKEDRDLENKVEAAIRQQRAYPPLSALFLPPNPYEEEAVP